MIVKGVVSALISLFIILFTGFFLRKRNIIDEHMTNGLSKVLTLVATPAMILSNLQKRTYSPEGVKVIATMAGGMALIVVVSMVITYLMCLLRKTDRRERGAWLCCTGFSNAIFMSRPIVVSLYGDEGDFALTGTMIGFNILIFSVGTILMNSRSEGEERRSGKEMLGYLVNPTLITIAISLALFFLSIQIPAPVHNALAMLTELTTPLSMIIVGSTLATVPLRELINDKRVYSIAAIRLILAPCACWLILRGVLREPMYLALILLMAAMPTATIVGVFAERYGNQSVLCSKVIFLSTIVSVVTIPVIMMLL